MAYDSLSPANSASNTDTDTKSLAKRFLVPALGLTMISAAGCSFKKNKDEDKAQNVTVITQSAPSADNIAQEEFKTEILPGEFGHYFMRISWPEGRKVNVRIDSLKIDESNTKTDKIMTDGETQFHANVHCFSGSTYQVAVSVLPKNAPGMGTNFHQAIDCPTDVTAEGEIKTAEQLKQLASITGRLKFAAGTSIETSEPLSLSPSEIITDGSAVIKVTRNLKTRFPDPQFSQFPSKLSKNLSKNHSYANTLDQIRSQRVPLSDLPFTKNWSERSQNMTPLALTQAYSNETGLSWIEKSDLERPYLTIKTKKLTGSLVLKLAGMDGYDGRSGQEIAESGTYQRLLQSFQPKNGKPGIAGAIAAQSCGEPKSNPRNPLPSPPCPAICQSQPTNGENGENGIVPGIDGFDGADGLPSASARIEIQDSQYGNIVIQLAPGRGGRGGSATFGQAGGSPGAPGRNPHSAICKDASPGKNGHQAQNGFPGNDGAPGFCGKIQLRGSELASQVQLVDGNSQATRCLNDKSLLTTVD